MKKLPFLSLVFVANIGVAQVLSGTIPSEQTIYGVDASSDGSLIFIAGKDSTATIWNQNEELLLTFKGHLSSISSIDYLDKKRTIITGSYDNTAILWGLDGGIMVKLEGHTNGVINVAQSSNFLATASRDKTAKIWDRNGNLLFTLNHAAQVNDIQFIEEKSWILTGSFDGSAKVWSYEGTLIQSFQGHSSGIRAVAYSISQDVIAAGHRDGTLSLWSQDGEVLQTIAAHGRNGEEYKMINSIEFNPNQSGVITAGSDGYVRTWHLDGKMISETWVAPEKDAYVSGIALSGNTLFTGSGGKKPALKIWELQ